MKTKISLLAMFFLLGLFLKAQEDDLVNNTWYLQKIVVEDVEYFQPFNLESTSTITASFTDSKINTHAICNWIESNMFTNLNNQLLKRMVL